MKLFGLIFMLSIGLSSFGQSIYGSISGGIQRVISYGAVPYVEMVNNHHSVVVMNRWENYSFDHLQHIDLHLGHRVNKKIGYELITSYIKPNTIIDNGYTDATFSGQFIQLNPKAYWNIKNTENHSIYMKIGALVTMGKLIYQQIQYFGDIPYTLTYEYGGDVALGINAGIGFSTKISKRISLFSEVTYAHQDYSPTYGKQIVAMFGDYDEMPNAVPYFSEMEFGDTQYILNEDIGDGSQPQKYYSRNYSLSGYGITLGITYTLWEKKEEDITK